MLNLIGRRTAVASFLRGLLVCSLFVIGFARSASADTTWDYTGDFITGSFTVPSLDGSLTDATIVPTSYFFFDWADIVPLDDTLTYIDVFRVSTTGGLTATAITSWEVGLYFVPEPVYISISSSRGDVISWLDTGEIIISTSTVGSWSTTPVPEPSSLLLLGAGLLGIMGAVRRKWLG